MRELKFRAWRDGELLEEVTPVANTDNNFFPYPAIVIFEANGEIGGTEEVSCIEQFTGLKDKNGEEIYEGDIVKEDLNKLSGCSNYFTKKYVVAWDNHSLGWGVNGKLYGQLWECNKSIEVIGNIHENKDLLK